MSDVEEWARAVSSQLGTLPTSEIGRNFAEYAAAMRAAHADARTLAEFMTFSRRRYEAPAGTTYLELPVTRMSRTEAFSAFVVEVVLGAERFASAYNRALGEYRTTSRTRSAAQPFPDLARNADRFELPFWAIEAHTRRTLWCEHVGGEVVLVADDGQRVVTLPRDPEQAIAVLHAADVTVAPKALALTMFARTFVCDLFIHGVGGGSYDVVADNVLGQYFGIEPPAFVIASLTMRLALEVNTGSGGEASFLRERLNRLTHNPDALLSEISIGSEAESARTMELAAEKAELVAEIEAPGADRKALGSRIRDLNAELGALLAPYRRQLEAELVSLEAREDESEILEDRTYGLCFWSPVEIADKAY